MKNKILTYTREDLIKNELGFENMQPEKWPEVEKGIDKIEIDGDIITVFYDQVKKFSYKNPNAD